MEQCNSDFMEETVCGFSPNAYHKWSSVFGDPITHLPLAKGASCPEPEVQMTWCLISYVLSFRGKRRNKQKLNGNNFAISVLIYPQIYSTLWVFLFFWLFFMTPMCTYVIYYHITFIDGHVLLELFFRFVKLVFVSFLTLFLLILFILSILFISSIFL